MLLAIGWSLFGRDDIVEIVVFAIGIFSYARCTFIAFRFQFNFNFITNDTFSIKDEIIYAIFTHVSHSPSECSFFFFHSMEKSIKCSAMKWRAPWTHSFFFACGTVLVHIFFLFCLFVQCHVTVAVKKYWTVEKCRLCFCCWACFVLYFFSWIFCFDFVGLLPKSCYYYQCEHYPEIFVNFVTWNWCI